MIASTWNQSLPCSVTVRQTPLTLTESPVFKSSVTVPAPILRRRPSVVSVTVNTFPASSTIPVNTNPPFRCLDNRLSSRIGTRENNSHRHKHHRLPRAAHHCTPFSTGNPYCPV